MTDKTNKFDAKKSTMIDKEKLKLKIEEQRQLIRPKNTGEMKVADIPTPLEQGWLNALKWMDELVDSLPKELTTEQDSELEEEITDYINKHFHIRYDETLEVGSDPLTTGDFEDAARHFANWRKQQMMKGAVDMIVGYWMPNGLRLDVDDTENPFDIDEGDKVKVIFVKEN